MSSVADVSVDTAQQRTLRVLSGGAVLGGVAVAGSLPAGSLLAASIADSEAVAGFTQTAGVVGAALLALPLARVALRHGRRAALSLGYGIGAVGALLVILGGVHRMLPLVLVGALLVGVATASGFQARYAATDLAHADHRARALSYVVWASTIGSVLGSNLLNASGNLGLRLGLPQLTGPYVVTAVALILASAVLFVFLRPDPYVLSLSLRAEAGQSSTRPTLREGLAHLKERPRAVLGIATISLGHIVMVMVMVMTPVHMAHVDVTLQIIGLVISVHVAGMYALSPVVGWLVDRFGEAPVIWVGMAILAASCAIAGTAPADAVWQLGVGLFLLGLGWSCTLIAGSALVTRAVDARERPSVQGLSDLSMNVAGAIGGAAAGLIVMWSSYGWLCAAALVPIALLAVGMLRTRVRS